MKYQVQRLRCVVRVKETKQVGLNGRIVVMSNIKNGKLSDLVPDNKNFNKHTEYGMHLLEKSISEFGLGRSIVVDKNNRVIGGNGVVETASNMQLEDCIIVPTNGKTLVVVKREDVDIDSAIGRGLCLADNATSKANLAWDMDIITEQAERFAIDPEDWGISLDSPDDEETEDEDGKKDISTKLIVECGDVSKLSLLFSELQDRGFKCELKE